MLPTGETPFNALKRCRAMSGSSESPDALLAFLVAEANVVPPEVLRSVAATMRGLGALPHAGPHPPERTDSLPALLLRSPPPSASSSSLLRSLTAPAPRFSFTQGSGRRTAPRCSRSSSAREPGLRKFMFTTEGIVKQQAQLKDLTSEAADVGATLACKAKAAHQVSAAVVVEAGVAPTP